MPSPVLAAAIDRSAAPGAVAVALERLSDAHDGLTARVEADERLRAALVAVVAASRSLTELCVRDERAIDVLADLERRPLLDAEVDVDALHRWKRLELLRIAARDLVGRDELPATGAALAAMAADVFGAACTIVRAADLAVIGMGKLGGCELNYASDVDVMFVGSDERAARRVMDVGRTCFRIDADLRPEGRNGPLVRSLESYEAYWERWAETWEFQALLKARPVAGSADLGRRFVAAADERLWTRPFSADDLRAVRSMKARAEGELARKGLSEREVKRGRGGIRDVEFSVQLLQLVHGRHDTALRSANTLEALTELARAGYVGSDDARSLGVAYRFLRAVEHRLQLVDEQQVHAVPTDTSARSRLARVMGYRDRADATALDQLDDALRRHQATVRPIHERLFFRPLLEAFAGDDAGLPAEAAEARLAAFGFTDVERTRQSLRELTRGLTRSSRLMQQLLPLLMSWLSDSPDPDLGLLGLRRLAAGAQQATELATAFRESPEAARRLCLLLGTSRLLGDALHRNPDLVAGLAAPELVEPRPAVAFGDGVSDALAWRPETDERQHALRRYKQREVLRIAARDVLGLDHEAGTDPVVTAAAQLTALAEASLDAALAAVEPPLPFAVVAMGRFGGGELSYASDLDVLFVYDGTTAADFAVAEATAEALVRFLKGPTAGTRIWPLDVDLRPEGKQGPLARSLDGYREYYEHWVETWERQALLRARPVAGDRTVGERFQALVDEHVWGRTIDAETVRQIRRMKARIERERIPAGEDPQFHLKLGRGSLSDVEFTAQLLQLQHGVPAPGTMAALDALAAAGALADDDHAVLAKAFRFCERVRNRWYLVKGAPGDSLPTQPEQLARLARSLDVTPAALREQYRRRTRRCRQVVERLFYGKTAERPIPRDR